MSDTILGGNFTVYYLGDNRQKRIKWTGAVAGTNTVNEVYSGLLDLFDELLQMDDGIPMSAQTPVEYTIGIIDSGDLNPWYIDYETMQHLKGGALRTASWTRVQDSNVGIVVVPVTHATNNIVTGDIGQDITHGDLDAGTLLDVIDLGLTDDYLVIRPDSDAAANNFDSTSGTLTEAGSSHTATQAAAATTGEQIWANLYSIGTIETDTHIYLYQGEIGEDEKARLYSIDDQTQDWWSDGHIDICIPIRDFKTAGNPIVDGGYVTVFARKGMTLYDTFEVSNSTTSGGRNPIPLGTAPDLDNTTGYKSITFTAAAGNWAVGDEMSGDDSGARAVITKIVTPGATQIVHYYLVDDPLTDFQTAAENLTNEDDTGTGTKDGNVPADQGPALTAWFTGAGGSAAPTAVYGYTTYDIDDDGTDEFYGVILDCNGCPLTHVYEWIKYITRRGETGTGNTDEIEGEQYIGGEAYLEYSGVITGTVNEGDDISQAGTLATGVIISLDTTNKVLLLRNIRGTFNTTGLCTSTDNSGTFTPDVAAETFSPKKQAPLGTFAGGTFFGARGVLLSDWDSGDENSFLLTPIEGGTKERPTAITIEVTNLVGTGETADDDDSVTAYRLTGSGGSVEKTEFSAYSGEVAGDTTLDVDTTIPQDVPGKTTGGIIKIRDASDNNKEYRVRFSAWANIGGGGTDGRFTLANINIASADAGTNADTVVKAGAFTNAKRGDLVYNYDSTAVTAVSYVVTVDDVNTIQIFPPIADQAPTDHIGLNCVPIDIDTLDDVYVPFIDKKADASTASVSVVYSSIIYFRVTVRNSKNATPIIPFSTDDSTSGTDRSIATIRTEDTIVT